MLGRTAHLFLISSRCSALFISFASTNQFGPQRTDWKLRKEYQLITISQKFGIHPPVCPERELHQKCPLSWD